MPGSIARVRRCIWLGVLLAALAGCTTVERNVLVWRQDHPGGVYPSGELSGDPAYFVGWRHPLYR